MSSRDSSPGLPPFGIDRVSPSTRAQLLQIVREELRAGGVPDWGSSAEWFLTEAIGCSRTELFSRGDSPVPSDTSELVCRWVKRRLDREPVQYIVGYAEFCGLRFKVDPRVLIPRQETELLVQKVVDTALRLDGPVRILDIGTGSGCIAIAVAHMAAGSEVWGADNSSDALDVAGLNGNVSGVDVRWIAWDVLSDEPMPGGRFSIMVSNPPYILRDEFDAIMPEVAAFEPAAALFVDGDPLTYYRAIVRHASVSLASGGYVFLEVNPDFADDVAALLGADDRYEQTGVESDLAGHPRIVWGRCAD